MTITVIVLCMALVMIGIELVIKGRTWPKISGWWGRALALNAVQVAMVFVAGLTWDRWLADWSIWNAETVLGETGGALFGYVAITFIYYWWHRARHQIPFLWRAFHQIHHSPQRLEIITSFYKHPLEIFANAGLSSFILYVLCGLGPQSAVYAILLTGIAELFYHWNVKTPYWIGFIFQRPESHCVHHKQGWHRQNFSDLPIWDMMFGTFHNPRTFDDPCGFSDDRELMLGKMLVGGDVHSQSGSDEH